MLLARVVTIALAVLFVGMGITHFVPAIARGMGAMIPQRMRGPFSAKALVRFTGVCEIAGGIGLLVPSVRVASAIAFCVFLLAVFPANVVASRHPERFGRAAIPLVPRAIGQLVLIAVLVYVAVADVRGLL
jgi:uncharacterized membrane protein